MKKILAIFLVCMTSIFVANAADSATFTSLRAAQDVALDLNPQSEFWRAATPLTFAHDNWGKPIPLHSTQVRSRWTENNLYFLFVCPYQELYLKPHPKTEEETNQLWNWDVAEVFIGSDFHNIRRYKEFELSPQGEWVDIDINLDSPHHEDGWVWNSHWQVAAHIDHAKKIWYGVMKIPFAAVAPHPPLAGTKFRINFYRTEGPVPAKEIVWQPTMNETFHIPERFGQLELVDRK